MPDPLPEVKDKLAGYPVTLTLLPGVAIAGATMQALEDEYGQEVPAWFSSPSRSPTMLSRTSRTPSGNTPAPAAAGRHRLRRPGRGPGRRPRLVAWTFTTQPPAEYGRLVYEPP
ncbi:MAG: hypothetical protein U0797_20425 [Gemmataceae bacterium]